ncbi:MAG: ATP-dependent protease ATPase subunit HslU [Aminobacterium sp.]|jgi:ATP-dependent HslUV protease ATP-binding subunit HslU|uniref:ATP-dependent protease ATPase subunit HslU n=1 Tax=unclassified Aminobacterium TaxID=2685012 RepID=UPI001BCA8E0A|nr:MULTISPECIES: ATP-dependent protease ATPase subunit HslU [unclassified Aminobacterium]MDD2207057.1 ATP-dependent protease ATPase subunit HslU [Aminobacterium sp.]MDD3425585.1 ATP-dependent protease ATPase subunit HslU [Aminobacterium sp.]MDD3708643.1 ATP-dependent protease ATPase subunit HslU [Aminobacterium sp.]MDD4228760.1 ATP-dependent protease ATPase subunit HslU [Aminobacterium sp.]MDD4550621.1 ATP-dependent protease ATPase subunit HslU [Aminobacterium sp.]
MSIVAEEKLDLTPRLVVECLDRYIIGQEKAKRAVAIALRNRIRRRNLSHDLANEIAPKNILMVGPTGVGKTEIARRLADLVQAPFVKVEATKFTEVGYVGRDVESMVRDLVEMAVSMVKKVKIEEVQGPAEERASLRLVDALLPRPERKSSMPDFMKMFSGKEEEVAPSQEDDSIRESTRNKVLELLKTGKLDGREVEIEVTENSAVGIPLLGGAGMDSMGMNINEMLSGFLPKKTKKRRMKVVDAKRLLQAEEAEKLIDMESVGKEALEKAQEEGIVFIDELDKVVARGSSNGPDVSREGVQRDLLPIVEGASVQTKYGTVKTDHILFIAAGAFSSVKPSDLVPELQGRFPIRVELQPLGKDELARILVEPENSLIKQYQALLSTENVEIRFSQEAIYKIAALAEKMNTEMENIGARRLHTMIEQLLEDISFTAPERQGDVIEIDTLFVEERLSPLMEDTDLRKYLL